jgi:HAMP domain-containing protein
VTAALLAVLALAAGWCIGRRIRRSLRRAAVTAERLARPVPDPQPIPDWNQLAEQATVNETFDEMTRNWNEDAT